MIQNEIHQGGAGALLGIMAYAGWPDSIASKTSARVKSR